MASSVEGARASATRVAKWLLDKGRRADAVNLLSAWAAAGPNDENGQALLAEALRIEPGAPVAKMAFERMEGIGGAHDVLEAAMRQFGPEELSRLEGEMKKPSFRRAQVGFNNNVKYKERVYHVQTEDSGLDKPHIITHLFADGGRILKSHKRSYSEHVERPDVALFVRSLMKAQHMEMVLALREGRFDGIIEGKERGGIDVLTHPPQVDIRKANASKPDAGEAKADAAPGLVTTPTQAGMPAQAPPPAVQGPAVREGSLPPAAPRPGPSMLPLAAAAPAALPFDGTPAAPAVAPAPVPVRGKGAPSGVSTATPIPPTTERTPASRLPGAKTPPSNRRIPKADPSNPKAPLFRLHVVRSLHGGPARYDIVDEELVIGSRGSLSLAGERFAFPREGALHLRDGALFVEDFGAGNGLFLRVRTPVEIEPGDEFIVGDQLLRLMKNPVPQNGPDPGPTYFYSSPTWLSSFRVVQVFQGGAEGACVVARGSTVVIGSTVGDLVLKGDPLVSDQHCLVEEQAGAIVLSDLASRTGVFVRLRGEHALQHGDEILVGRTRLVVDLHRAA